jgi:hypothetical protein
MNYGLEFYLVTDREGFSNSASLVDACEMISHFWLDIFPG